MALLIWAGVTVYTVGFHYHHPDEGSCEENGCPFLIVSLNVPLLFLFVLLPVVQLAKYTVAILDTPLSSRHIVSSLSARAPPPLFSKEQYFHLHISLS